MLTTDHGAFHNSKPLVLAGAIFPWKSKSPFPWQLKNTGRCPGGRRLIVPNSASFRLEWFQFRTTRAQLSLFSSGVVSVSNHTKQSKNSLPAANKFHSFYPSSSARHPKCFSQDQPLVPSKSCNCHPKIQSFTGWWFEPL